MFQYDSEDLAGLAPGVYLVDRPIKNPILRSLGCRHWAVYDTTEHEQPVFHHFQQLRGFVVEDAAEPTTGYRVAATATDDYNTIKARALKVYADCLHGRECYRLIEFNMRTCCA
jgi:hypothetical protein